MCVSKHPRHMFAVASDDRAGQEQHKGGREGVRRRKRALLCSLPAKLARMQGHGAAPRGSYPSAAHFGHLQQRIAGALRAAAGYACMLSRAATAVALPAHAVLPAARGGARHSCPPRVALLARCVSQSLRHRASGLSQTGGQGAPAITASTSCTVRGTCQRGGETVWCTEGLRLRWLGGGGACAKGQRGVKCCAAAWPLNKRESCPGGGAAHACPAGTRQKRSTAPWRLSRQSRARGGSVGTVSMAGWQLVQQALPCSHVTEAFSPVGRHQHVVLYAHAAKALQPGAGVRHPVRCVG